MTWHISKMHDGKETAMERIVISLPQELLTELTELARDKGLSRASYIRMALTERVKDETREREQGQGAPDHATTTHRRRST